MNRLREALGSYIEHILPWFVLAILLFYSYAKFFEHPYQGFKLDADGRIIHVYVQSNASLQPGDRITKIGSLRWEDYKTNLRKRLFDGIQPGQTVQLEVERPERPTPVAIMWKFPGPNADEIIDLLGNEGWLAFAFWLIGSFSLFILRPKDERWRLIIGFNYLTAIWLVAGSGVSFYHIWNSAIVLRMAMWLCVPVYLFLNWVFPKPLGRRPQKLVWGAYLVAIAFAVAEWFELLPPNLYFVGFVLAIGGSVALFIAHAVLQAEVRRDVGLVMVAGMLSLLPAILLVLVSLFSSLPITASIAVLSLPFLPLAYFYAAYRHQLGNLEVRVNRIVLSYVFITLLGMVLLPFIAVLLTWLPSRETAILIAMAAVFASAIVSIFGFPHFQSVMERRLLGIHFPFEKLQENYAARIVTSTSVAELGSLLQNEVLPSLLVRQFVFLHLANNLSKVILAIQTTPLQIPEPGELPGLLQLSGKYLSLTTFQPGASGSWIRLVVPLHVGKKLVGFWLFGRRDPDDIYSQVEIPSLQALADQTAIALSYIVQTEHVKTMYQANIDRHEDERLHLALDLHDGVLNQIAAILMKIDTSSIVSSSEITYGVLIQRLREIISNLRPPMLNYGLKPTLDELADQLMEQTGDGVNVTVDIESKEVRYPANFEQHLYRIVQEACQNSVKHGRAKEICISGRLDDRKVSLQVEDNGTGFDATNLELDDILANKHFGLAGMIQRAELIGAEVHIDSTPGAGARITITWSPQGVKIV
jgi:two-component system sensor histidine kinase DegS